MGKIKDSSLEKIKKLYYVDNLSVPEIARQIRVPLDATYYFFRSHKLVRRNQSEQNRVRFVRKTPSFQLKEKLTEKEKGLKTLGVSLYWGEGYKAGNGHTVDFANSDVFMIEVFLNFLRTICGIQESKLRVYEYICIVTRINIPRN